MLRISRFLRLSLPSLAMIFISFSALADSSLDAHREGDMKKLIFHETPRDISDESFLLENGDESSLLNYQGQYLLVNFWATWCAPCRREMPHLAKLQKEFGGDDFQILTIATGHHREGGIERFMSDIGVDNLPRHYEPGGVLAAHMGVVGLPMTMIINREGQEIARLFGEADWSSKNAYLIIEKLINR